MKRLIFLFVSCLMLSLQHSGAQSGQFISADRFSSSLINYLCQDVQGSLWIATDYGLNRFDGYQFQSFLHSDADGGSIVDNMVVILLSDSEGHLWVGTKEGLDRFDTATESFVHYAFPEGRKPRVSSLLELHDGRILVGTAGYGAFTVTAEGSLTAFPTADGSDYFSRTYEDSHQRLWHSGFDETIVMNDSQGAHTFRSEVGTPQDFLERNGELLVLCMHGIMVYSNNSMKQSTIDMSAVSGQDVVLWNTATAPDGGLYIGTRGNGLYCIPAASNKLERVNINVYGLDAQTAKVSYTFFDGKGNLWMACHRKGLVMMPLHPVSFQDWSFEGQGIRLGSTISSVCEGDNGMVWATVQGVGVYGFNSEGRVVAHPAAPNAAEFVYRDRKNRYWLGTDDGLYSYDPLTGHSQLRVTFDCDRFNDMSDDADGNIYISTFSRGFCTFNPETGELRNHSMDEPMDSVRGRLCNNWVMAMMPDRNGHLWLATSSGVACYDPKTDSFRSQGWNQLLDGVMCYSLCETIRGDILIGTGRGLYIYEQGAQEASLFPRGNGLKDKVVSYIVETNDGDLWCSTAMGLWQYDASEHDFIGHLAGNDVTKKEYISNVGLHTDDDRVFFGHNDGFTAFSPSKLKAGTPQKPGELQLTAFRVGDQFVTANTIINEVKTTDGKAVGECSHFTLSYLDHTVTLAFSLFDFESPQNVTLEYRVNGDSWVREPAGKNNFTLGHMQPGSYRIEVRAELGGEYSPSKVVVVTVRAPWYRTTLAYILYAAIILTVLAFLAVAWRRRARRQLEDDKMKFLINATHDIRSPLTIILSALKKLETNPAKETIERNSQRILNLVNQILDVRKIDKQQMHLHCQQTELVAFTRSVFKMYEYTAKEKNIKYVFEADPGSITAWVDRAQWDKVVGNLLSNAFKYNNEGGEVTVRLGCDEKNAILQVLDTGIGLDSDSLRHIFERFYQGSNSRRHKVEGTGIGLNLCKMIVDMHHGTIVAGNRDDGRQGSVFTVTVPLGTDHLKPEEIEQEQPKERKRPQNAQLATGSTTRHRVLIVDDDLEIGQYVQQELGRYYKFTVCHDGKEGLKELLTGGDYEAVVSDVMMPEMDGFTMLRMIKSNLNLSHMPVVMLTSMADVANRLEGLEHGADAFLAKPFDMEELHLTIENLIQSRRHLKGKYSGAQQQVDKLETLEVKGNDEQLMERIMKAVNKNLSDSDFNVEMLCQEVGISRAQLHRKMKEMTGLSTSEFIRNIRLEQAARLLKEQKINVTQVAYTVGFSNLAHFSTIFRRHFGVTPSEYAEN